MKLYLYDRLSCEIGLLTVWYSERFQTTVTQSIFELGGKPLHNFSNS